MTQEGGECEPCPQCLATQEKTLEEVYEEVSPIDAYKDKSDRQETHLAALQTVVDHACKAKDEEIKRLRELGDEMAFYLDHSDLLLAHSMVENWKEATSK